MIRLLTFTILIGAAALVALATAPQSEDYRAGLEQRIAQGGPDRHRAAFLLGELELGAAEGDHDRAIAWIEQAAEGGYLPAVWLLARRYTLGGWLGQRQISADPDRGCRLLARLADAALTGVDPTLAPTDHVDDDVSRGVARTTAIMASRLSAKHCPEQGEARLAVTERRS